MGSLQSALAPYLAVISLALVVVVVGLLAWCFSLSKKLKNVHRVWDQLSTGAEGGNLEQLLHTQLRRSGGLEAEVEALKERMTGAEGKLKSAKRYVGLTRYNAFNDVGGEQSFALAVYDEEGNGAVITSQVGRMDCRVFGKSLVKGKSETSLTVEEQAAIESAVRPTARPRITS